MAFNPKDLDPSKIKELIAKGLVIDTRKGTITAEHFETHADPERAKQELEGLAEIVKVMSPAALQAFNEQALKTPILISNILALTR